MATDESAGVPRALPDDATTRWPTPPLGVDGIQWEVVDNETVKVTLSAAAQDDASDGVPVPLEAERSATAAVVIYDLDVALAAIMALARRDRIYVSAIPLRVDLDAAPGEYREIALQILDWRRFAEWYPKALREAERSIFRSMDVRKATAAMFRLRLLADEVVRRQPPGGLNHLVLRIS